MVDFKAISWIKKNMKKGYSSDYLKKILLKYKYSPNEIEELFNYIKNTQLDKKGKFKESESSKKIKYKEPENKRDISKNDNAKKQESKASDFENASSIKKNKPKEKLISFFNKDIFYENKKIFLILGISLGILILLILTLALTIIFSLDDISNKEISSGSTFNLKKGKEIDFNINEEKHKLELTDINSNSAELIIESDPIKIKIKINEEKHIDINNNGIKDIYLSLKNIEGDSAEFYIKKQEKIKNEEDSLKEEKQETTEYSKNLSNNVSENDSKNKSYSKENKSENMSINDSISLKENSSDNYSEIQEEENITNIYENITFFENSNKGYKIIFDKEGNEYNFTGDVDIIKDIIIKENLEINVSSILNKDESSFTENFQKINFKENIDATKNIIVEITYEKVPSSIFMYDEDTDRYFVQKFSVKSNEETIYMEIPPKDLNILAIE